MNIFLADHENAEYMQDSAHYFLHGNLLCIHMVLLAASEIWYSLRSSNISVLRPALGYSTNAAQ